MRMLRFRTMSYLDKACTSMEAFSLLVPAGWACEGDVRWSMDNPMLPATCGFKASGQDVDIQALPGHAFFWTSLPHVRLSHPVGSRYLGATVCPPLNPPDFLRDVVLPAVRPNASDMEFVQLSPPVDMGSTLGYGETFQSCRSASSSGASARVLYVEDGRQYEEELYCTVTTFPFRVQAGGTCIDCIFWIADHLISLRAERGRLAGVKGILQTIVYSFRLNPRWLEKYNRITLFLKDRQLYKPYSLRQLSADVDTITFSSGDLFSDGSLPSGTLRQSAYRWIADSLSDAGLIAEYYDPIQQICVWLPAGYDLAWVSETGEYVLGDATDDSLEPGVSGNWQKMEPMGLEPQTGEPSPTAATCI